MHLKFEHTSNGNHIADTFAIWWSIDFESTLGWYTFHSWNFQACRANKLYKYKRLFDSILNREFCISPTFFSLNIEMTINYATMGILCDATSILFKTFNSVNRFVAKHGERETIAITKIQRWRRRRRQQRQR